MRDRLAKLTVRGFKSIRSLDEFPLGPLNLFIGPNGAGKSNLIQFFKMLNWMTPAPGNLQFFISKYGGANSFLHDGSGATPQIEGALTFESEKGINEYYFRLFSAARDTLIFAEERYRFSRRELGTRADWKTSSAGHRETELIDLSLQDKTAETILWILKSCVVHQFHNTSDTARIRQKWSIEDNRRLKEDGANLAPVLYHLQKTRPDYYKRILSTIRQVAPFFGDFEFKPEQAMMLLQWRERDSDQVFSSDQASDGSLRMFALITLLLWPEDDFPSVLIMDEPELGLHPHAIQVLAGLLKSVSRHTQVILATQSADLVDCFQPEDIVVVDRPGRESIFKRLNASQLAGWLDEYSLSELWDKNVLGGKP